MSITQFRNGNLKKIKYEKVNKVKERQLTQLSTELADTIRKQFEDRSKRLFGRLFVYYDVHFFTTFDEAIIFVQKRKNSFKIIMYQENFIAIKTNWGKNGDLKNKAKNLKTNKPFNIFFH